MACDFVLGCNSEFPGSLLIFLFNQLLGADLICCLSVSLFNAEALLICISCPPEDPHTTACAAPQG